MSRDEGVPDQNPSDELATHTAQLRALFGAGGALFELSWRDGNVFTGYEVHFGYQDGIAQPANEATPVQ